MSNELKRCPFCNGMARLYFDIGYEGGKRKRFTVAAKCWSCDAQGQGMTDAPYDQIKDSELIKKLQDAATWRWNRRAA